MASITDRYPFGLLARMNGRWRRTVGVVALAVALPTAVHLGTEAQELPDLPPDLPMAAWYPNGPVYAVAQLDNTVYLGGDFTSMRNPETGATVSRSRMAAIDVADGSLLAFAPTVNSPVWDIEPSQDNSQLFIAGQFTRVDGATRGRVAAIDRSSGQVVPGWRADADANVLDLEVADGSVFMGGNFSSVNGSTRLELAQVDEATGLSGRGAWTPPVDK